MKNPCEKTCPERTATCHCTCSRYKAFRDELDEKMDRRNKEISNRPLSHDLEMKYRKKLKAGKRASRAV